MYIFEGDLVPLHYNMMTIFNTKTSMHEAYVPKSV